ncbi:zinc finger CCCH domain-containing protein 13-like [Homarus americanus]|uniref:zinc finger CCCH domain-containing protein 13-like n=1 Tax=Homarus americanus TaxID=6706 RepID=UPI001C481B0C|nr:zinc finger CCCH domain-containing protein 13-like [Homarus americanus]
MVQVYMVQAYMVQVSMAQVYMAQVYMAQVYMVQVYMVQVYMVQVHMVQVHMVHWAAEVHPRFKDEIRVHSRGFKEAPGRPRDTLESLTYARDTESLYTRDTVESTYAKTLRISHLHQEHSRDTVESLTYTRDTVESLTYTRDTVESLTYTRDTVESLTYTRDTVESLTYARDTAFNSCIDTSNSSQKYSPDMFRQQLEQQILVSVRGQGQSEGQRSLLTAPGSETSSRGSLVYPEREKDVDKDQHPASHHHADKGRSPLREAQKSGAERAKEKVRRKSEGERPKEREKRREGSKPERNSETERLKERERKDRKLEYDRLKIEERERQRAGKEKTQTNADKDKRKKSLEREKRKSFEDRERKKSEERERKKSEERERRKSIEREKRRSVEREKRRSEDRRRSEERERRKSPEKQKKREEEKDKRTTDKHYGGHSGSPEKRISSSSSSSNSRMVQQNSSGGGAGGGSRTDLSEAERAELERRERIQRYKDERRKQIAARYGTAEWSSSEESAGGEESSFLAYRRRRRKGRDADTSSTDLSPHDAKRPQENGSSLEGRGRRLVGGSSSEDVVMGVRTNRTSRLRHAALSSSSNNNNNNKNNNSSSAHDAVRDATPTTENVGDRGRAGEPSPDRASLKRLPDQAEGRTGIGGDSADSTLSGSDGRGGRRRVGGEERDKSHKRKSNLNRSTTSEEPAADLFPPTHPSDSNGEYQHLHTLLKAGVQLWRHNQKILLSRFITASTPVIKL